MTDTGPHDEPHAESDVCEGWWHPNVKSGQVHDHPEHPGRSWQTAMHRQCEQIYTKRVINADLAEARAAAPHDRQHLRETVEKALTVTVGGEKLGLADSVRLIVDEEGADALIDTVIDTLAGARVAASEPLVAGEVLDAVHTQWSDGPDEVRPCVILHLLVPEAEYVDLLDQRVSIYRADQIAGVTREQVDSVVFQWFGGVIADWTAVNGLEVTETEAFRAQDALVGQLMALLRGEGA